MSDIDPENGDVLENPEPEEDFDPVPEGQNDDDSDVEDNVEAESEACSQPLTQSNPEVSGEKGPDNSDAETGCSNQENSFHANAEAARRLGEDCLNNPSSLGPKTEACAGNTEADQNNSNQDGVEVNFIGADWSLEPEDAIDSQTGPCQGTDNQDEDEAESLRNHGSHIGAETESFHQLSVASRGTDSEHKQNALAVSQTTEDADVHSSPAEEDYFQIADEVDLAPEAGGYMDQPEDIEPTEADRRLEGDTGPIGNMEGAMAGSESQCNVTGLPDSDGTADTGESQATLSLDEENLQSDHESSLLNLSHEASGRSVPEDEISVSVGESLSDKVTDAESYAPECDQSSSEASTSAQSSPSHSEALRNAENFPIGDDDANVTGNPVSNIDQINSGCPEGSVEVEAHIKQSETTRASVSLSEISLAESAVPVTFSSYSAPALSLDNSAQTLTSSTSNCDTETTAACGSSSDHPSGSASDSLTQEKDSGFSSVPRRTESLSSSLPGSRSLNDTLTGDHMRSTPRRISEEELEDELLSELDATLQGHLVESVPRDSSGSVMAGDDNSDSLRCDQCLHSNLQCSLSQDRWKSSSSNIPEVKELKRQLHLAKQLLLDRECEITRLKEDLKDSTSHLDAVILERDSCQRQVESLQVNTGDDLYIPQIKELEYTIAQQQAEMRGLKDKLSSHDSAAKRAIATLQNEMRLRIEQVTKMYEDAVREKDSMVVKFAQAEHKNLEYIKAAERAEMKLKESDKEKESMFLKLKALKEQRAKMGAEIDARNADLKAVQNELDKHRELLSSADVRVKWAQNKLKSELEAHKDTKANYDKTVIKLKEAKEETQQIRRDCQAIIKTYQESEEVKSNSLDKELKLKETELLEHRQQKNYQEEAHIQTLKELDRVKENLQASTAETITLKEKFSTLESELSQGKFTIQKYENMLQRQKKEIHDLRERIEQLVQVKGDFHRAQELIKTLDAEIAELKISNKDFSAEIDACRRRETDKLELTEKLSAKNAELQSENTNLCNKVLSLTAELQTTKMEFQEIDTKYRDVAGQLEKEQKLRQEENQSLNTRLAGKLKAVEDLTRRVDEDKDEIKTLKRKHANNIKDLTRQLQQVKRKLETYESSTNGDKDTTSMGSRTSSNGSLNTVGVSESNSVQTTPPGGGVQNHTSAPTASNPSPEQEYVMVEPVEVDKQMLIERIVKLQRAHARKNEKIEFMDDHISQLVDEIQKKNKIIQNYVLREETGTMTSDMVDKNKPDIRRLVQAELSRKHSIMGSMYSSHSTDGTMTLDLSLEINRKLQAVLEDTLLKNMTLKESLDTLGQEIARLSQENRRLQLHLQGKGRSQHR